uniref:Argininosuccinate lyase n=1 Tax=uncultured Armatimonadetes bacterium TaxID=157466 RepID=A0A6J4J8A7_9BACT|nr:Argininosuccinate lyase [uncultured Armatimonadetes bacterium]
MALWGGRFEGETDALVWAFNQSLPFDRRLWRQDIRGSIAHARMLARQGIVAPDEGEALVAGLKALSSDLESGAASLPDDAEDIHSAVEGLLRSRIGPVAGKLHTARSRNDQVATDVRLWLKDENTRLREDLARLRALLVNLAEANFDVLLPGRTHHQHAQPIRLAHHLLAYFWMFSRDDGRLADAHRRADALPLGAGALAGTPFPIDREFVREQLGFAALCENSLDAVADRDFAVEFCAAGSLLMLHLSRLAEEIVLWNTPEFGFVELDDAVTTGSSIMPQKKNPDVAELIRGKTGRVYGDLITLLTLMKGLVLAYNKDMQEDKEPLFDTADTVSACVRLMTRLLAGARFRPEKTGAALHGDFSTATDLADALAAAEVPFREAHEIVGRLVRECLENGRILEDLSLEDLRQHDGRFPATALHAITPRASADARRSRGGTGAEAVREQIRRARAALEPAPP